MHVAIIPFSLRRRTVLSTRCQYSTLKRSKSYLTSEAIQLYIEDQSWQIEAINVAIKQADTGNFASDNEVKKIFKKWGVNAN